jgi:hypothetical protein
MRFANRLARLRGADEPFLLRIERLLDRLDSPRPRALDESALLARMGRDKKARESGLTWVLPLGPARGARVSDLPPERVADELRLFAASLREV